MTPDEIARLINEDGGSFKLEEFYTDKHIEEESFAGAEIAKLITYGQQPGMNHIYFSGDDLNEYYKRSMPAAPTAVQQPQSELDEKDEFEQGIDDLCGILVFYTGTPASWDDVVASVVKWFIENGYEDDWREALRYH